ncbi:MAG: PAS domain S-box protein [Bryobacterales bacterium]|nr:PAS domain S-box protein [Bryobacterales bacterium]
MEAAPQPTPAAPSVPADAAILAAIVHSSDDAIISKSLDGYITTWNSAAERLFGYTAAEVIGQPIAMLAVNGDTGEMPDILSRIGQGQRVDHYETERRCRDGRIIHISLSASPIRDSNGILIGVSTIARDITARKAEQTARQMQRTILEMVAQNASLPDILTSICVTAEFQLPGTTCFVLQANHAATSLTVAAAPNLPAWYIDVLKDGLPIGPMVGTCGTAAYLRQPVLTSDIDADPAWAERKHWPQRAGYRSCWSFPILSDDGDLYGTFAAYGTQPRLPTLPESEALHDLLHLARIAVRRSSQQAALRASEARFRAIFELAAVGLATCDNNGCFLSINERMAEITGYSQAELLGKSYLDVTHPDDRPANRKAVRDLFAGMVSPLEVEKRYVRKDCSIVWVRTTVSVVRDTAGNPIHSIAIVEDITARRQAEEQARESEARYRFLAEAIPQFVWMADDQGNLTYANQHWHAYTGLTWEQTLERGWTSPVHPEDQPRVTAAAIRSAQLGVPFDTEYRLLRHDGQYRWHLARAHRFPLADGRQRWLGTAIDIEERKLSESALHTERERLQLALDAARMGTWEWDIRTGHVTWSHELQLASGLSDFTGTYNAGMATVHPDDYQLVQQAVDRSLNENAPYDVEYRTQPIDGSIRWIQGKGRVIPDASGAPAKLMGIAMDITSRKLAEAEAARTARLLERTLSAISESFISLDRQWRFLYANDRVIERTGYPREALLGNVFWDLFPSAGETLLFTEYHRVMEDRVPRLFEVSDPRLGPGQTFEVHAYPTDEGMCAYVMNITDRKRAEDALKEREEFYRTLGEAVPDFIWLADAEGQVIYVNQGWQKYTGRSLDDLKNLGWNWFNHPEDVDPLWLKWDEAHRTGVRFEAEFRYRRHDGRYCWFMGRAVPIRDAATGEISQWVGTSTEIQKLKEAEETLRRYNIQLEEFAFAAAHDLQEPLRNVSIYSELLTRRLGDRLDGQERDFLQLVRGGALRMSALVRDLLLYTRVLDTQADAPSSDSAAALREVLDALTERLSAAKADVIYDKLPTVPVPHPHLVQIFQNLISNAIKYRDPRRPPEIQITTARATAGWLFSISDNGIGIHPDYHQRVFGLFKRLHGQEIEGTGIGLTIVKRIIEHYGGKIWLESEPGHGTTFRFTLPAASDDQDHTPNPS